MAKLSIRKFTCLDSAIADHCQRVDEAAEQARGRFLTSGAGQAMAYQSKLDDATRYLNNDAGSFPWLGAEAKAQNKSMREVAIAIVQARENWDRVGSEIEIIRLQAKSEIRSAGAPAVMHAITNKAIETLSTLT